MKQIVPDVVIWSAAFELLARTSPKAITTPTAFENTAFENTTFDTPFRHSSASQNGTEQMHDEVDQRILEELTGRIYYNVTGFYKRCARSENIPRGQANRLNKGDSVQGIGMLSRKGN